MINVEHADGGTIEWNLWGEKRDSEGRGTDNWEIINEKPLPSGTVSKRCLKMIFIKIFLDVGTGTDSTSAASK